ncbi:hypothetical protein Nepgr_023423 [Nepenthes gracilis]|uniref:Integrase catalytic domain-containing protein n=1 Tax=Nepenthes gracilis TaxID=150966 RepID=A0AAD3T2U7_NEPGR|nr:hypothetical protein Nepgr_023423 [Nepenthes gracilis]
MTPYLRYQTDEALPEDAEEAKWIKKTVGWYTVIDRQLYCRDLDYFIKWVEVTPLAKILEHNAFEFICQNIVSRFDISEVIVTDNGTQFSKKRFTKYCTSLDIRRVHTSMASPQANGQVDVTNRTLLDGLKTKLEDAGSSWLDELPSILWSYQTTPKEPTHEMPFNFCYGIEVVIPIKIELPSLRVESFDPQGNSQKIWEYLDLLEETHDAARMRTAAYQH